MNRISVSEPVLRWALDRSTRKTSLDQRFPKLALAKQCVVVTREQFDASIRRKVKIPNACQAFSIKYVDTFQMMRELGVRVG